MKKFKSKKKSRRIQVFFFLIFMALSFALSLSFFSSFLQKEEVVEFLIHNTLLTKQNSKNEGLLDFLLLYTIGSEETTDEVYVGSASQKEYTPDPNPEENQKDPIIYLYNTHQGEEYKGDTLSSYDVIPTVMFFTYRFREELNQKGLKTIVETSNMAEILRVHGWNYASSYQASRLLMDSALEKNPTLEYFLDLHRDSIPYQSSFVTYQNKTYAKILFVIGKDHQNYSQNLELAKKVSSKVNEFVPGLSRGILEKGGSGVNGIYNQDFSPNTLLIEIGGEYNKMNEVNNTLSVLASAFYEIVKG